MKRNRSSQYAVCLLLATMLFACSKKEEPPQAPAPVQVAPAAPVVQPAAPVQKQLSSAAQARPGFDFSRRRDPFRSAAPVAPAPVAAGESAAPAQIRPSKDQLPIQSFEVSKFKVAGIIAGLQENRALLVDPDGKGYVVQKGMRIGSNNGRITRITASSVEVVESFRADGKGSKKRKIVLTLAKKR